MVNLNKRFIVSVIFIFGFLLISIAIQKLYSNNIATAYSIVKDTNQAYKTFNLNLDKSNIALFKKLNIDKDPKYNNYGDFKSLDKTIYKFINSLGENDPDLIKQVSNTLINIINKVMTETGNESAWITIRPDSDETNRFKRRRWHTDGKYYTAGTQAPKFIVTLIGPGTLFYNADKQDRKVFEEAKQKFKVRDQRYQYLHDTFINPDKIVQLKTGQAAFFKVGDKNYSAIHSEPYINTKRLFLSLVLGTKDQIKEREKRQKQFDKNSYKLNIE